MPLPSYVPHDPLFAGITFRTGAIHCALSNATSSQAGRDELRPYAEKRHSHRIRSSYSVSARVRLTRPLRHCSVRFLENRDNERCSLICAPAVLVKVCEADAGVHPGFQIRYQQHVDALFGALPAKIE